MQKLLLALAAVFAPLSLATIGGGQAVVADIQRQVVGVHHWMTAAQFLDAFAISRMAPGPGSLLVTLIGWDRAGFLGAIDMAGTMDRMAYAETFVERVISEARAFLGDRIATGHALREQHSHGEDPQPPVMPDAVAFVQTTEEVSRLLALCHAHGVPVV